MLRTSTLQNMLESTLDRISAKEILTNNGIMSKIQKRFSITKKMTLMNLKRISIFCLLDLGSIMEEHNLKNLRNKIILITFE